MKSPLEIPAKFLGFVVLVGAWRFLLGGKGSAPTEPPAKDSPSPPSPAAIPREEGLLRAVFAVSGHEGGYGSTQPNKDGNGVSFGIIQWTQRGGGLGTLLRAVEEEDPDVGPRVFTPAGWATMLAQTTSPDPQARMAPVLGQALWSPQWLPAWATFGAASSVQAVQRRVATSGEWMEGALDAAQALGISSERAIGVLFDRAVQQGPGAIRGAARGLAALYASNPQQRPTDERILAAQAAHRALTRQRRDAGNPPQSASCGDNCSWVQLVAGSPETDLAVKSGQPATISPWAPTGPVWHAVTRPWRVDLWDDGIRRSVSMLNTDKLRDAPVDLGGTAA